MDTSLDLAAVIDTSIICEIVLRGPQSQEVLQQLSSFESLYVASPCLVEATMVLSRVSSAPFQEVQAILRTFNVQVVDFRGEHAEVASDAFLRYGKGRHPAALNFGDCLTYAAAKVGALRLLYLGNDFAQTDLAHA